MNKYTIWQNHDLNLDDYREGLIEAYGEQSEDELTRLMYEENTQQLHDEMINLKNIAFDEPLILIADIGRWDGRHSGYAEVESGKLVDCFSMTCGDYVEWYVDAYGNLRCTDWHHDGTNYYVVRVWKSGISETLKEKLRNAIMRGAATPTFYGRYTNAVGVEVANVYGWKVRGAGKGA